ncbi:MAG: hypothetical protein H5U38_05805 [Calditrichaeota bacterium]|nr:hypothetical protein [Calditrichota bacterium]
MVRSFCDNRNPEWTNGQVPEVWQKDYMSATLRHDGSRQAVADGKVEGRRAQAEGAGDVQHWQRDDGRGGGIPGDEEHRDCGCHSDMGGGLKVVMVRGWPGVVNTGVAPAGEVW